MTGKRVESITTYTGKRVWPTNVRVKDIDALDIAHSLGNLCRYNGHVRLYYSVAQHSCLVHDYASLEVKKEALLHDGTEAYIGDMVAPLKHQGSFEFFRELEFEIWGVICEKFNMDFDLPEEVEYLDKAIREAEIRDLKNGIGSTVRRHEAKQFPLISSWSPQRAKAEMIKRMRKLGIEVSIDHGL